MNELERKELARNIRHRLADMLGSMWTGALDAAMDEMLLDEFDKYFDQDQVEVFSEKKKVAIPFCTATGKDIDPEAWARLNQDELNRRKDEVVAVPEYPNDGGIAWPLRDRKPDDAAPDPAAGEFGDPYLKGIMDRD